MSCFAQAYPNRQQLSPQSTTNIAAKILRKAARIHSSSIRHPAKEYCSPKQTNRQECRVSGKLTISPIFIQSTIPRSKEPYFPDSFSKTHTEQAAGNPAACSAYLCLHFPSVYWASVMHGGGGHLLSGQTFALFLFSFCGNSAVSFI